jgi:hypothetical protein
MSSASNVSASGFRSNIYFFSLMVILLGASMPAQAQMFSVKPQRETIELPGLVLALGLERMDATYSDGTVSAPFTDLSFSADVFRLQLETGGLMASYTTGRGLGSSNVDYTSLEFALASGFQLLRRDAVQVGLPFFIYSVNTTMTSRLAQITNAEFRQNALGLRTGLQTQVRLSPRTRIVAYGTGGYAFSANGFNSNGGNVIQWDASARLHVDGLFRSAGLTTGVMLHQRRYDVDIRAFNYDVNSLSILLGVTF